MKNWITTVFCALCLIQNLSSQHFTPDVLTSNGGVGTAAGLQLEWSLGELAVDGLTGQAKSYTEGFHQPILPIDQFDVVNASVGGLSAAEKAPLITLSPNPVSTNLTVHFNTTSPALMTCQIRDAKGTPLLNRALNTLDGYADLEVANLPPGLYFIHFIAAEDGATTVFKIVKN